MSEPLRKGWCPGALRPMAAGDGLIVRLRLTGGILPAATARTLATLAERHGNGRFDLSARANLQMRGVSEPSLPTLVDALRELGLVDADADAEAVRNVIASPLAGLHAGPDIRGLVATLEARLAATAALHALPGKFGFLVDDGSAPTLAAIPADVRFDWSGTAFAIGLGGTRTEAVGLGTCGAAQMVDVAESIARGALALFARIPEARRMRDLIATLGAAAVTDGLHAGHDRPSPLAGEGARRADAGSLAERDAAFGFAPIPATPPHPPAAPAPSPTRGEGDVLALAPPYGRLDAGMLRVAAALASAGELRLTPWRSLLLPGAGAGARESARRAGFIVDAADPRLAVAACVGAPECARATTTTRADADALADLAAALQGEASPRLHVSGCAKGCALSTPAPVTLVGREGRYDVVIDGRAGDPPVRRGLDLAAIRTALAAARPG